MRKIIIMVIMSLVTFVSSKAQMFEAPTRASTQEQFTDTTTTYTYKMNDNIYNVYRSRSGAFYIWKTSKKSGKMYKYYLPKMIQSKMGRKYEDK